MLKVAVIGATGAVGQEFVIALNRHPWFELVQMASSERSAGKKYMDALRDPNTSLLKWHNKEKVPENVRDMILDRVEEIDPKKVDLIFTALESEDARVIEPKMASEVPVISTAAAFRYEDDVPILIPGINDEHCELLNIQKKNRKWNGFIAPLPNCTTTGMAITLKPLMDDMGLENVFMTSMQALSGAGRSPGVVALDIMDNVVPYIPKEEEKVETETRKILGRIAGDTIEPAAFRVSATCTRVPVLEAHTEAVFVSLKTAATLAAVKTAMRQFGKEFLALG